MALVDTTINLSSQPSRIVAGENPIIVALESASTNKQAVAGRTRLTVTTAIPENFTIQFNLEDPVEYTNTFTAKNFPDRDQYFLTSDLEDSDGNNVDTPTALEIANSIADALSRDLFISKHYYINFYNTTWVDIISKVPSSRYDLTAGTKLVIRNPAGSIVTTGITITKIVSGSSAYQGNLINDYSVFCDVYSNSTNQFGDSLTASTFTKVDAPLSLPYPQDNIIRFNITDIAKAFVTSTVPDLSIPSAQTVSDFIKPFFCTYGEQYPLIQNTNTSKKRQIGFTSFFWVTPSALELTEANSLASYTASTAYKFFTNSPAIKKSNRDQSELLYVLVPKNINKVLKYKGNITFWDGTTLNSAPITNQYVIKTGSSSTNTGGLYKTNVSFMNLGLDNIETTYNKKVKKVDLRLYTNQDNSTEYLTNGEFTTNINNWHNITAALSANFSWNAGNGGCALAGLTSSNLQTVRFVQSGLTLNTSTTYTLAYHVSLSGGFQDRFIMRCLTTAGGVLIERTLESGMTGTVSRTGSFTIPLSAVTATTRIDFKFSTLTTSSHSVLINRVSLTPSSGTSVVYSNNKVFEFPFEEPSNTIQLLFKNRLATYDSFTFAGLNEVTFDRTKKDITLPVLVNEDGSYPNGFVSSSNYDIQITKKITCNSGWIDEATFNWLEEVLNAPEFYRVNEDQTVMFLKLDSHKYAKNSGSNDYFIECTFLETNSKNAVTV